MLDALLHALYILLTSSPTDLPQGLGWGYTAGSPSWAPGAAFQTSSQKPGAVVFIDGQNLYHAVRAAFGRKYPDYDVVRLAELVCSRRGWRLTGVRFYTGVPEKADNPYWYDFWSAKLTRMLRQGVHVYRRALRFRDEVIRAADGSEKRIRVGREKGIDLRLGLDVVRLAHRQEFDVAVIFSQDQDLSEVAEEIRVIAKEQKRFLKIASAFPVSPIYRNIRGVDKTDWIRFTREEYEQCLDGRDYRVK